MGLFLALGLCQARGMEAKCEVDGEDIHEAAEGIVILVLDKPSSSLRSNAVNSLSTAAGVFGLGFLRLVQIFAWLVVNGKANTKDLLRRKGMRHLDSKCIFCHVYDVTTVIWLSAVFLPCKDELKCYQHAVWTAMLMIYVLFERRLKILATDT